MSERKSFVFGGPGLIDAVPEETFNSKAQESLEQSCPSQAFSCSYCSGKSCTCVPEGQGEDTPNESVQDHDTPKQDE